MQMTAGNLASQDAYLGFANPGSFVQSGGTISPGGGISLYLAYNANGLGTYSLSGIRPGGVRRSVRGLQRGLESLISRAERTRAFAAAAGKSASWSDTSQAAAEPPASPVRVLFPSCRTNTLDTNTGSIGTFQQTSGSNNADGLFIGTGGRYTLGGGTLPD